VAVIVYLRKEIIYIFKNIKEKKTIRLILMLILATIPAVILGFLLKDKMEGIFVSLKFIGLFFIITSAILWLTMFFKKQEKTLDNLTWKDSLFVGLFQAVAILPGVSRSGSTISASIFRNFKREDAFRFSFLMSIPVILGAFLLQFYKQKFHLFGTETNTDLIGFIFAVIFGLVSLKIIERVLVKGKLHYFAIYCFILGLVIMLFIQ
jgi:undecaprenyl-diphosphatase